MKRYKFRVVSRGSNDCLLNRFPRDRGIVLDKDVSRLGFS